MSLTKYIEVLFKRFLPSPFAIAVLLTMLTVVLALLFAEVPENKNSFFSIISYWEQGLWNTNLLVFAYQMMLILVLGHILVLSTPVSLVIEKLTRPINTTAHAVIIVSITTMLVAFFNWGLGLIFGAILARKIAEASQERGFKINYPLIGASAYVGLMVWHGGISGSAPSKVSEKGHLQELMQGISSKTTLNQIPDFISYNQTIFSSFNLILFLTLLLLVPLFLVFLSKKTDNTPVNLPIYKSILSKKEAEKTKTQYIDRSPIFGKVFGVFIVIAFVYQYHQNLLFLIITPNMLNFLMLGLALLLHKNFRSFLHATEEAIKGTTGILLQFPLYFGIMGIMKESGMVVQISNFFASVSNQTTLPIYTFFSAGLVNIFIPSGGGQWAIQGPIVVQSALKLNIALPKIIMALSYGDQITNMLQPFWALPLLGITKLKAKEILPYTLLLMFLGGVVFLTGLLLF